MFKSHGDGNADVSEFGKVGINIIIEMGVRVFHPKNIELGDNVYIGHDAYLKAYHKNKMIIGNNVWVGQNAFLHSGGGIVIEDGVGIGPDVKILTLNHVEGERNVPILYLEQEYKKVVVQYGVDIGIGAIIMPGVTIGRNSIIGAGSIVTRDIPSYSVAVGSPAKVIRRR